VPLRSGKRFIFDKAHSLGVRTIIVDGPDSWAKSLVRAQASAARGACAALTTSHARAAHRACSPAPPRDDPTARAHRAHARLHARVARARAPRRRALPRPHTHTLFSARLCALFLRRAIAECVRCLQRR
jgi:hypothetical protein